MKYQRFEDLPVWQTAIELGQEVYTLTETLPESRIRNPEFTGQDGEYFQATRCVGRVVARVR